MKYYFIIHNYLYWRPNRRGYTNNILEAGIYTEEEAISIERIRGEDVKVPISDKLGQLKMMRDQAKERIIAGELE